MSPVKYPEEKFFVNREIVLQHVSLAAAQVVQSGLPGLDNWRKGKIKAKPVEIFDINGRLLFLDYPVTAGKQSIGTIRAAASTLLGKPVVAHEIGARMWDFDGAVKELTPKVKRKYKGWRILETKLVCYSYPKLGVMFMLADKKSVQHKLIFDVVSLAPIPIAKSENEGAFAWSYYESISDEIRASSIKKYKKIEAVRARLSTSVQARLVKEPYIAKLSDVVVRWIDIEKTKTKELQFCHHYDYNEARSHHCFVLHGQQLDNYCAVATCQMVLCYYRYYYTQNQIAPALNYSPRTATDPGGCPSDQSAGYEQLSYNNLDATYDTSPTWEKARDEIDKLQPFKTGITGHARACAGYAYTYLVVFPGTIRSKMLLVYDPWPWNANYKSGGSVYWEDWDSVTHTNYVLTKIKTS